VSRSRREAAGERPGVWLADVLRALGALRPSTAADRRAIAHGLGFRIPGADADAVHGPIPADEVELSTAPAEPPAERPAPILEILEPAERATIAGGPVTSATAVPVFTADALDVLPPFMPLLRPDWSRGVLAAANETLVPDGPIDVDAMVERAARLEPLETVPRRPRPSLHRGVQLLVDIGEGMQPFRRDQEALAEATRSVVGKQAVEVLYFRDCPTRPEDAGPGSVWTWTRYRAPDPRRPVLVLSDFGIGGPPLRPGSSSVAEWVALARRLARRESRLSGLVPYPPARLPPGLRAVARLVEWDRSTSRAAVRQALGRPG
jgi:hypothetical protein